MRWYFAGILLCVACKPRFCPDDGAASGSDGGLADRRRHHGWFDCIPRPPEPDGGGVTPPPDVAPPIIDAAPDADPVADAAPEAGPSRPGRVVVTLTNASRSAPYVAFYDTVNPALLEVEGREIYPKREIPLCDGTPYPTWWIRRRPQPGEALVQVWDGSVLELSPRADGGQCWDRVYLPSGSYPAFHCYEAPFVQLSPWGPRSDPFGECFRITLELPASGETHVALTLQ